MKSTSFYEQASELVGKGLSVIPVYTTGAKAKRPHMGALKAGGQPGWKVYQERHPTREELRIWDRAGVKGIALVTGKVSGVVALDFDGEAGLAALKAAGLTPHVLTPSGGAHVFFRHPGWWVATAKSGQRNLPAGVDLRGDGGYVLLPPTVTDRGAYRRTSIAVYQDRAEVPLPLLEAAGLFEAPKPRPIPAARMPAFVREEDQPRLELLLGRAEVLARRDGRNNAAFWLGCQLRDNGYGQGEALSLFGVVSVAFGPLNVKGQPEVFTQAEYAAAVRSAFSRPPRGGWEKGHGK